MFQARVVDRNVTRVLWPRPFSTSRMVLEIIGPNKGEATELLRPYAFITF